MATIIEKLALIVSSDYTIMMLFSLAGALFCETYKEMDNGVIDNWNMFLFEIVFSMLLGLAVAIIVSDRFNTNNECVKYALSFTFAVMGHNKVVDYIQKKKS